MGIVDELLPLLNNIASALEGDPSRGAVMNDLHTVETLADKHAANLEAEIKTWLIGRLYPLARGPEPEPATSVLASSAGPAS
jgi:hypothetical protein